MELLKKYMAHVKVMGDSIEAGQNGPAVLEARKSMEKFMAEMCEKAKSAQPPSSASQAPPVVPEELLKRPPLPPPDNTGNAPDASASGGVNRGDASASPSWGILSPDT